MQQCVGYALRYVSGHSTTHYRYDRYRDALGLSLRCNRDFRRTDTIVHVDVGCGPGLFAWVVYDYFRSLGVRVDSYGYDHAPEMVRLSRLIEDELETEIALNCYDDVEELLHAILARDLPADIIVTFGHVLVQLVDDDQGMGVFATILEHLAHLDRCLLVAVDAHGYRTKFQRSYNGLCETLETRNLAWNNNRILGPRAFGVLQRDSDHG